MIKSIYFFIVISLTSFLFLGCYSKKPIKVACVGDSITFGARLEHPDKDSYPAKLQEFLGKEYDVVNFGISSCTVIRKGQPTVWNQLPEIKKAEPNIVIISLGTNDTCGMGTCGDRKCWEFIDEFENDYIDLINDLKTMPSNPEIWICAPTPMVLETPGLSTERIDGLTIRKPRLQKLIGFIKNIAKKQDIGFIDLNAPLAGKPELFTENDGVHPNKKGYHAIGKLVFQAIK
jgi:lysophospholipase L1-like esterase